MKRFFLSILFFSLSQSGFGGEQIQKEGRKRTRPTDKIATAESQSCYPLNLSVCAIFKDEAPYFKEWIEYHKMLGVQHFRLYNNDSTDNYLQVLEPYILQGDVTLIDWPSDLTKLGPNEEWVWSTQWPALSDAVSHFTGVSKWLAIIDVDEFIVPTDKENIVSFLEDYERFAGVLINWQNFGTSGIWELPAGKLMIETLTWKAKKFSSPNHQVKSIVRPDFVNLNLKAWCPHTWSYLSSQDHLILPNYQKWRFGAVDISKIRINHYVHRTDRHFYEHKIPNKERMMGEKLDKAYIRKWKDSCNQEKDTQIFKFVPALRERVFE